MTKPSTSVHEKLLQNVDKTDSCWLWTAGKTSHGYGVINRPGYGNGLILAHRLSYEQAKGPIPSGLHLDHLCRVRHCVNPEHLEAVTPKTNVLRGVGIAAKNAAKTHCVRGHEFTPENTRIVPRGRDCKECARMFKRIYRARAKQKVAA